MTKPSSFVQRLKRKTLSVNAIEEEETNQDEFLEIEATLSQSMCLPAA